MSFINIMKRCLELSAIGMLYFYVYRQPEIKKDFKSAGVIQKNLVIVYFTLTAFIQCFIFKQYNYPQKTELFPFTRWAMFSGVTENIRTTEIFEFQGLTYEGKEVYLNPARLFFTSNACVHFTKTHSLARRVIEGTPEEKTQAARALHFYMEGLRKRYEEHTSDRLKSIALWRRKIELKAGSQIPAIFKKPDSVIIFKVNYLKQ